MNNLHGPEVTAVVEAALSGARLFYCIAKLNKPISTFKMDYLDTV
ncbi:hypothetical protein XHC_2216 [Xanthomonas hortorum pv. carotae str. M081]|nr:hypothetical protein XHC_2216 [Xanthomonas hortorum pv. carotae str. M081]